jgi:hypothetical protein
MALRLVQPSAQVTKLVQDRLMGYVADAGFRTRALSAAKPSSLGMAAPHPVFQLGLDQVGKPGAILKAAMSGWRYLITSGVGVVAAAHVRAKSQSSQATFSHLNEGARVASTQTALAKAEKWPEIKKGRYALGLLSVPALYVDALWLRDEDGRDGGDIFVPLAPSTAPLVPEKRYSLAEFESALAELKQRRSPTTGASN